MPRVGTTMSIHRVLAQATVTDLATAVPWYTTLFGRGPDATPMPGLAEWHLVEGGGLQVFAEPERAGRGSVTLGESDLDAAVRRLAAAGLTDTGATEITDGRALVLADPDGNRVVLVGV